MSQEHALQRSIDTLAARFPHLPRQQIATAVHGAYEELAATARVTAHLTTLAQRRAADELAGLPTPQRSEGEQTTRD